jgi:hypothetical protein
MAGFFFFLSKKKGEGPSGCFATRHTSNGNTAETKLFLDAKNIRNRVVGPKHDGVVDEAVLVFLSEGGHDEAKKKKKGEHESMTLAPIHDPRRARYTFGGSLP